MRALKLIYQPLYYILEPIRERELTETLLAGVGQVVVAGHVAPAAAVMPHHHCTVLAGEEVAVRLPAVPVLIELKGEEAQRKEARLKTAIWLV